MRKKVGRPPFKPTRALRQTVELMRACGDSPHLIALAIGIDDHTLTKYFADELAYGLARQRRKILGMLTKSAEGGNVAAQKYLHSKVDVVSAEQSFTAPERQPAPEKIGKKEQALREAATAGQGTGWGEDLEPKTVN